MKKIKDNLKPYLLKPSVLVGMIAFGATVLASLGVNSWKFSFVGDEWVFYDYALSIASGETRPFIFSLNGVYGENPVLGSYWQALFISLIGESNFSWRLSNTILLIPIVYFSFYWVRVYFSQKTALISSILIGSSFYILNYVKIGYPNPQAFTLFILSLYLSARAGKKPNITIFILLGLVWGVGFYIYIGPLIPIMTAPFLLPLLKRKKKKETILWISVLAIVYTGIAALSLPSLSEHLNTISKKTIMDREFDNTFQIVINISRNFILFFKNYDYLYNHFIQGPYLIPLTGIFTAGGMLYSLMFNITKKRYLLIWLSFVSTAFILGLTSPYSYAPTTRGIFLVPFGVVFAAIILSKLTRYITSYGVGILIVLIVSLNVYKSQYEIFKNVGYTRVSLVLRELMVENENKQSSRKTVLLTSPSYHFPYTHFFPLLTDAYGLNDIQVTTTEQINKPCNDLLELNTVIVFDNDSKTIEKLLACQLNNVVHINTENTYY